MVVAKVLDAGAVGMLRREPAFRRYLGGQAVSLIGTWTETVAQALLVLRLDGSGFVLGLMTALRFLPALALSSWGGVLADRAPKRQVLLVTQTGLGCVSLVLGLLVVSDAIALWEVAVLGAAFGILSAVDAPARLAFTAELVREEHIRAAVTSMSTAVSVARAAGPALAGVVATTVGVGACFLLNAASFVVVIAALASLGPGAPRAAAAPHRRRGGDLRAGLRLARARPDVLAPLVMMALIGTLAYELEVTLPLVARDVFDGGAALTSHLLAAFGVGAVVGALRAAARPRSGVRTLVRAAAVFGLAMLGAAAAPDVGLELPALAVAGAASVTFLTTGNATAQLAAGPEYRGRVAALWSTAYVGSTPIGALVVGAVADAVGARWSLVVGAAGCLVAAACGARIGRRR
jgi:MFS family permease